MEGKKKHVVNPTTTSLFCPSLLTHYVYMYENVYACTLYVCNFLWLWLFVVAALILLPLLSLFLLLPLLPLASSSLFSSSLLSSTPFFNLRREFKAFFFCSHVIVYWCSVRTNAHIPSVSVILMLAFPPFRALIPIPFLFLHNNFQQSQHQLGEKEQREGWRLAKSTPCDLFIHPHVNPPHSMNVRLHFKARWRKRIHWLWAVVSSRPFQTPSAICTTISGHRGLLRHQVDRSRRFVRSGEKVTPHYHAPLSRRKEDRMAS